MEKEYTEDAKIFKALCDEKRLKIISLLRYYASQALWTAGRKESGRITG